MFINRLKRNESTLNTFTTSGEEIKEGHILGYGDNYACVVLYNKFEAKFELIEFGYSNEGYPYRTHDIMSSTDPYVILGHIDNPKDISIIQEYPEFDFDYTHELEQYY